jgi:hypothetical protein
VEIALLQTSSAHSEWVRIHVRHRPTSQSMLNNVSGNCEEQLFSSAMDPSHPVDYCALQGYHHQNTSMRSAIESSTGLPPPQKFPEPPDQRKPSHRQEHESITGFKRTSRRRTGELICAEESAGWLQMAPPPQKFSKRPNQRKSSQGQDEHESIIGFTRTSRRRTGELICEEESAGWLH